MSRPSSDPRQPLPNEADVRPVVAASSRQISIWVMAASVAIGAVLLFIVLDGQRRAASAPSIQARPIDTMQTVQAPPPLYIFPEPQIPQPPPVPSDALTQAALPPPLAAAQAMQTAPFRPAAFAPQPPPPGYAPPPSYTPAQNDAPSQTFAPAAQAASPSNGAVLVIDTTAGGRADAAPSDGRNQPTVQETSIRSGRLTRTATTVPQGTLIPAVLETALDSTRAGNVRAVISRDVLGFDGSRVLIPRGSRLFGKYQTDLAAGQNRALVEWTRLVRPDGVTITLASPAGDLQGRTGIRGRVDSHFLERFGSAVLQTALNIGASAAGRSLGGNGGVVVALPGSNANIGGVAESAKFQPTLRVEAGTRVTVLVAHDLEFTSGGARR